MKIIKITQQAIFSMLIVCAVSPFISGCKNSNEQQRNQVVAQEKGITEQNKSGINPLPDMDFDAEQFGENEIESDQPLTAAVIEQMQIVEIDRPLYQNDVSDFKYYLLKELYNGENGKILLISRTSEMENFAWLATYDMQNKLVDSKTVYYDEWAESAVRTTSAIRNNKIIISQFMLDFETGNENKKVNTFYINEALKFVSDHS